MGACIGRKISTDFSTPQNHRDFLGEHMEADFGLLDKLRANRTLTDREIADIKSQRDKYGRNAKILDYIFSKDKTEYLTKALKAGHQNHIVNYLVANGERGEAFGEDWPLTEREIMILDNNREQLIEILDVCDLISRLFSVEVINTRQREFISSESADYMKNEALLDIIRRRSVKDYNRTIQCLRDSNQAHVALLLEEGGVFAKVHVAHSNPTGEIDRIESEFVKYLKEIPDEERLEAFNRICMRIIDAKRVGSIDLYVHCETMEELTRLPETEKSGELTANVQSLLLQTLEKSNDDSQLNHLISGFNANVPEDAYKKCLSYFTGNQQLSQTMGRVKQQVANIETKKLTPIETM